MTSLPSTVRLKLLTMQQRVASDITGPVTKDVNLDKLCLFVVLRASVLRQPASVASNLRLSKDKLHSVSQRARCCRCDGASIDVRSDLPPLLTQLRPAEFAHSVCFPGILRFILCT